MKSDIRLLYFCAIRSLVDTKESSIWICLLGLSLFEITDGVQLH